MYYNRPQDAPETTFSSDGTTLHRYRVEAVIFAPNEKEAKRRLDACDIYLNGARLIDGDAEIKTQNK
jgi:hypothetical protein